MPQRIDWPPKARKELIERGLRTNYEGQPTYLNLHRYNYDRALRGSMDNYCCNCGAGHLLTFEIFRDHAGRFFLVKRAYRIKADKAKQKRKK